MKQKSVDIFGRIFVKLLAITAAACLALPLASCTENHIVIGSTDIGDYRCSIYADDTCLIISYIGDETVVVVPETLGGYAVTGLAPKAFEGCASITKVQLPSSVTELPAKLFYKCENLTDIYIPAAVRRIGSNFICECDFFTTVHYGGTEELWMSIDMGVRDAENYVLENAEHIYMGDNNG